jgi:hypothetical protein
MTDKSSAAPARPAPQGAPGFDMDLVMNEFGNAIHDGDDDRAQRAQNALYDQFATLRAQAVAGADDTAKVTRFEVIDYRASASSNARSTVEYAVAVTLSYQDDGRTLKVFLNDRTPERAP